MKHLETEFVARRRGEISDFGFRISDWSVAFWPSPLQIGSLKSNPTTSRVPARQRKAISPRATANVQRRSPGARAPIRRPGASTAGATEALNVVDQVITPRNRSEQVADFFSALSTRSIECVRHA